MRLTEAHIRFWRAKKAPTADLIGAPLDWAVARCLGMKITKGKTKLYVWLGPGLCSELGTDLKWSPSTKGDVVLDIMERERVELQDDDPSWLAKMDLYWKSREERSLVLSGPTLRIAVCRCYVVSVLGDEVEIPEELLK